MADREMQEPFEESAGEETEFACSSMYGVMRKQGLVVIEFGGVKSQVLPEEARRMGLMLLDAAGAAEHDEAFMHALAGMGMGLERAAQMLMLVRKERASREDSGG